MSHQLTITFASAADKATALKQIVKAKQYAYRDSRLGAIGTSLLVEALVRAKCFEATTKTTTKGKVK